jgi:thiamine-monophosphate kinase
VEFKIIDDFFKPYSSHRADVLLGIGDDCALVKPPRDQLLAISTDTLVEGVHFLHGTSAHSIGHKALAVSLSDLAAMGAEPAWVLLSLSLPHIDEDWLNQFRQGFFQLASEYNLPLIGGNTCQGSLSIATHIIGVVPPSKAITRSGAQPGDGIYITGYLGEAGLALLALQHKIPLSSAPLAQAQKRLDYPDPRIAVGLALRGIASAAIDISDGLAADLSHILEQSQVGASIPLANLPISPLMQSIPVEKAHELILSAGDDYELCFTVPAKLEPELKQVLKCPYHCIGVIDDIPGLRILDADAKPLSLQKKGYEHF